MKAEKIKGRDDRVPSTATGSARDIAPEAIRDQLHRIVGSPRFVSSPRLQEFLEYVIEESLSGRAARIKGFSVGHAVFDGGENFDPQTNTIVRVEAGRLRRRISQYYLTAGRDDPILIDIPKGSYAPVFSWNEIASREMQGGTPEPGPAPLRVLGGRAATALGAGTLVAVLGLAGWWFFGNRGPGTLEESTAIGPSAVSVATPFVAVLPFASLSDDPLESRLSAGLVEAIITDFSKLSGLSVMAHASMLELGSRSITVDSIRGEFGATHVLRGSLERHGETVRVYAQLVDTATTSTVWADRFDGSVGSFLELEDRVTSQIVASLSVQIGPRERERFLRQHTTNTEALVLFRQAITLMWAPNDMARIRAARQLFHGVNDLDPDFAGAYAGESMSYVLQVLFQNSGEPAADLEKAIALAKKAVEVDAEMGLSHAALGFAYTVSGRSEEGLTSARQAVAVQPGDPYTQWLLGVDLVLSGHADMAFEPLSAALRLNPAEPRTPYLNLLGIAHYATGDYAGAVDLMERNLTRGGPSGLHMDVFRASAYAELGQEDDARAAIEPMLLSQSEFPAEAWLLRWLGSGERLQITMNSLYRLGLPQQH